MNSTFSRAFWGFILLSAAIIGMALVALWSITTFAGDLWWASILIVLVALVVEVGIYTSTLHEPIYYWIKEPARLAALAEEERIDALKRARDAKQDNLPGAPVNHVG